MIKYLKKNRIFKTIYIKGIEILKVYFPKLNYKMQYYFAYGKNLNLENPSTFSEKLIWLCLNTYRDNKVILDLSDKYLVRRYVSDKGLDYMLNDLYFVWDDIGDIDYNYLPQKFVLKRSQGCTTNIICKDKSLMTTTLLFKKLNSWNSKNYWYDRGMAKVGGVSYRELKKYYICEKYLEQKDHEDLTDYKVYCFNGLPTCILVISDRYTSKNGVFMSLDWELISYLGEGYKKPKELPQRPQSLDLIISAAKKLSEPFPFVRVDMYEIYGKPVFGEMTFFPNGCIKMQETKINGIDMGEMLDISKR